MASVVSEGYWVFGWPGDPPNWGPIEPSQCAAQMAALGIAGVVVQSYFDAPTWLTPARIAGYRAASLDVAVGIGSKGPSLWQQFADAAIQGLWLVGVSWCGLDWEGSWDNAADTGGKCADRIYAGAPSEAWRVIDFPWAYPEEHPAAPNVEFGRIMRERAPQMYGGGNDGPITWTAHARSWYAKRGTWRITPTVKGYGRSVASYETMANEPTVLIWNWTQLDGSCKTWLSCRLALRRRGFEGAGAVGDFQRWKGLTVDYILGPKTAAALGVTVYPGTVWS